MKTRNELKLLAEKSVTPVLSPPPLEPPVGPALGQAHRGVARGFESPHWTPHAGVTCSSWDERPGYFPSSPSGTSCSRSRSRQRLTAARPRPRQGHPWAIHCEDNPALGGLVHGKLGL